MVSSVVEFLGEAKNAADALGSERLWWRGHAVATWRLLPKVLRPEVFGDRPQEQFEREVTREFMTRAPARYAQCPEGYDMPAWLFLMQHYGCPTRLLDWSESALAGLYFAVEDGSHDGDSADVWVLSPRLLNHVKLDGYEDVFYPLVPTEKYADWLRVLEERHGWDPAQVQDLRQRFEDLLRVFDAPLVGLNLGVHRVFAVAPPHRDMRMLVQNGRCTAHGTATPLDEIGEVAHCLRRIPIAADAKGDLRRELLALGVSRMGLFPDLENLSVSLAEIAREAVGP